MKKRVFVIVLLLLVLAGTTYSIFSEKINLLGMVLGPGSANYMQERPYIIWTLEDPENTLQEEREGNYDDWFSQGNRDYGNTRWSKIKIEPPIGRIREKTIDPAISHKGIEFSDNVDIFSRNQETGKIYWARRVDSLASMKKLDAWGDYFYASHRGNKRINIYTGVSEKGGGGTAHGQDRYVPYNDYAYSLSLESGLIFTYPIDEYRDSEIIWHYERPPFFSGDHEVKHLSGPLFNFIYKDMITNVGSTESTVNFLNLPNMISRVVTGANASTGDINWIFENMISAVVYKDRIYTNDFFYIYSLDAETGEIIWKKPLPYDCTDLTFQHCGEVKAVDDEGIFLSKEYVQNLFAEDEDTKSRLYKYDFNGNLLDEYEDMLLAEVYPVQSKVFQNFVAGETITGNDIKGNLLIRDGKTLDQIGKINSENTVTFMTPANGYVHSGGTYSSYFPQAIADGQQVGEIHVYEDEDLNLDASLSYNRFGTITGYEWRVNSQTYQNPAPQVSIQTAGNYRAVLKICDDRGYCDSDSVDIIVHQNQPPEISNVYVSEITDTTATIHFESDKLLNSAEVVVGQNHIVDVQNYEFTDTGIQYSASITRLNPNQEYSFEIKTKDMQDKESIVSGLSFKTSSGKQNLILDYNNIEDTYLHGGVNKEKNFGSAGTFHISYRYNVVYGLLKFALNNIPDFSHIEKGDLILNIIYGANLNPDNIQDHKLYSHYLNSNIDFGRASYKYKSSPTKWNGNKYSRPVFGVEEIDANSIISESNINEKISDYDFKEIIQEFVNGRENKGLLIRTNTAGGHYYASSEYPETEKRPKVIIDYYPAEKETTSPEILDVNTQVYGKKAVITWKTNKPTTTELEFGFDSWKNKITDRKPKLLHKIIINNLQKGKNYNYIIKSKNSGKLTTTHSGSFSTLSEIATETPFLRIHSLKDFPRSLILKWDLSENKNIKGYNIYRSFDGNNFNKIAEIGNRDSFQDSDIDEAYYKIKPINFQNLEGQESNTVSEKSYIQRIDPIRDLEVELLSIQDPRFTTKDLEATPKISWTTPYIDNFNNEIAGFDYRISPTPITEQNFFETETIQEKWGKDFNRNHNYLTGGSNYREFYSLSFDKGEVYYIAIKAYDKYGTYSKISNIAKIEIPTTFNVLDMRLGRGPFGTKYVITSTRSSYGGELEAYYLVEDLGWISKESFINVGDPVWSSDSGILIYENEKRSSNIINALNKELGIHYVTASGNGFEDKFPVLVEDHYYAFPDPQGVEGNKPEINVDYETNNILVGETFTAQITTSDVDGDTVQVFFKGPEGMTYNKQTRSLSWTPTQNQFGENLIILYAFDGNLGSGTDFVINVLKSVDCEDGDDDTYPNWNCGGDDCDDSDYAINPSADEVCDEKDNNCDFFVDEGCQQLTMDNDDENVEFEGAWEEKTSLDFGGEDRAFIEYRGDNFASKLSCKVGFCNARDYGKAIYKPDLKISGKFKVYVAVPSVYSYYWGAEGVEIIVNNGDEHIIKFDQNDQADSGIFREIGEWYFDKDIENSVAISNKIQNRAGAIVAADAIKLVKVEECQQQAQTETNCNNGIDEDCDKLFDCGDPDCSQDPACEPQCTPLTPADTDCDQCVSSIELLQYMVRWKQEHDNPNCATDPQCTDAISLLQAMVAWKETHLDC